MTRTDASLLTRKLLDQYNLKDWHIKLTAPNLSARVQFLGKCSYQDKSIYLNMHHIDTHPSIEVEDTIRHEIAHALVPNDGHGELWKAKARELGASPNPCASYSLSPVAIDAMRSGHTVEVGFKEEIIRRPLVTITRLQEKCPTCGKVAKEKFTFEANGKKVILLECGHHLIRVLESSSPFHSITFDGDSTCKHEWNKTICSKCNAKKLYPFQVEGARFLEMANGRALIADEMGLGKTVQANAWIKYHPEGAPYLFIVKSGIKFQWMKEITRQLGMEYLAQVIGSSNDYIIPGLKCYIISYDMLVSKVRTLKSGKTVKSGFDGKRFIDLGIRTIVLDECQQIKNVDSSRTQEVRKLVKEVPYLIALSGTPWKNRGSEFFPVLNMLDPIRFSSYQNFLNKWVDTYYDGNKIKLGGIQNIKAFREYTKDIVIRRERIEVMPELPLISRNANYVEMDEVAQKAYSTEVRDFVKFWNEAVLGGEEDSFQSQQGILARLVRMRHITGLAKIPSTIEFVKDFLEETDRKLVVFVHHKDVGQILFDQLLQVALEMRVAQPLRITSDMSGEDRFSAQEQFNGPNKRLMIASTLASGEGLNLQSCSDCILHERQWNPANEEQAEGRFIRIGQQANAVTATYMLAEGSIDDILHNLVEKKRGQFNESMNKGETAKWNESNLIKDLASAIVMGAK